MKTPSIAKQLLIAGRINESEFDHVLNANKLFGEGCTNAIKSMGYLNDEELTRFISLSFGHELLVKQAFQNIDDEVLDILPMDYICKLEIIPVKLEGSKLKIAMEDPSDRRKINIIRFFTEKQIVPCVTTKKNILEALKYYYNYEPSDSDFTKMLKSVKYGGVQTVSTSDHAADKSASGVASFWDDGDFLEYGGTVDGDADLEAAKSEPKPSRKQSNQSTNDRNAKQMAGDLPEDQDPDELLAGSGDDDFLLEFSDEDRIRAEELDAKRAVDVIDDDDLLDGIDINEDLLSEIDSDPNLIESEIEAGDDAGESADDLLDGIDINEDLLSEIDSDPNLIESEIEAGDDAGESADDLLDGIDINEDLLSEIDSDPNLKTAEDDLDELSGLEDSEELEGLDDLGELSGSEDSEELEGLDDLDELGGLEDSEELEGLDDLGELSGLEDSEELERVENKLADDNDDLGDGELEDESLAEGNGTLSAEAFTIDQDLSEYDHADFQELEKVSEQIEVKAHQENAMLNADQVANLIDEPIGELATGEGKILPFLARIRKSTNKIEAEQILIEALCAILPKSIKSEQLVLLIRVKNVFLGAGFNQSHPYFSTIKPFRWEIDRGSEVARCMEDLSSTLLKESAKDPFIAAVIQNHLFAGSEVFHLWIKPFAPEKASPLGLILIANPLFSTHEVDAVDQGLSQVLTAFADQLRQFVIAKRQNKS